MMMIITMIQMIMTMMKYKIIKILTSMFAKMNDDDDNDNNNRDDDDDR